MPDDSQPRASIEATDKHLSISDDLQKSPEKARTSESKNAANGPQRQGRGCKFWMDKIAVAFRELFDRIAGFLKRITKWNTKQEENGPHRNYENGKEKLGKEDQGKSEMSGTLRRQELVMEEKVSEQEKFKLETTEPKIDKENVISLKASSSKSLLCQEPVIKEQSSPTVTDSKPDTTTATEEVPISRDEDLLMSTLAGFDTLSLIETVPNNREHDLLSSTVVGAGTTAVIDSVSTPRKRKFRKGTVIETDTATEPNKVSGGKDHLMGTVVGTGTASVAKVSVSVGAAAASLAMILVIGFLFAVAVGFIQWKSRYGD